MARKGGENRGVYEYPPGSGRYLIDYKNQYGKRQREVVGQCPDHDHSDGKRCMMLVKARNLAAQRRKDVKAARLFPGPAPEPTTDLLAVVLDRYLDESRATKDSWRDDERFGLAWDSAFPGARLADVTPSDIERWRREKLHPTNPEQKPMTPATANRYVAFLRHVFNVAIRDGLVERNPVVRVKQLRENNARVRWLKRDEDNDEEERLRAELRPEVWEQYVLVALDTGLRQGEQFALRWDDVDMARRIITVRKSKSGKKRHIPMTDAVYEAFLRMPSRLKSEWVYPAKADGHHGAKPKGAREGHITFPTIRKQFEGAVERARVENFHWHDLRHTFASRLVMQGASLRDVMELLGHSSYSMVLRYAHLSPDHQREAIARLNQIHAPTSPELPQPQQPVPKPRKKTGA